MLYNKQLDHLVINLTSIELTLLRFALSVLRLRYRFIVCVLSSMRLMFHGRFTDAKPVFMRVSRMFHAVGNDLRWCKGLF